MRHIVNTENTEAATQKEERALTEGYMYDIKCEDVGMTGCVRRQNPFDFADASLCGYRLDRTTVYMYSLMRWPAT